MRARNVKAHLADALKAWGLSADIFAWKHGTYRRTGATSKQRVLVWWWMRAMPDRYGQRYTIDQIAQATQTSHTTVATAFGRYRLKRQPVHNL